MNETKTGVPVLAVDGLSKAYGATQAVANLSFSVKAGEILGLLGPNGAGKTTTINMIMGVLEPDSGRIAVDGIDLLRNRRAALERINFAAVYAPLPGNLTVYQNLRVCGFLYSVPELKTRIETLLHEFDLVALQNTRCGLLSSGEQTRVCLAKAMLNTPRLLLLDEPTASLDPSAAGDTRGKIRELVRRQAIGVLWTSHNMNEVEKVCDRVIFVSHGKMLLEGDPRTVAREHGKETLEELFITLAREPLVVREE